MIIGASPHQMLQHLVGLTLSPVLAEPRNVQCLHSTSSIEMKAVCQLHRVISWGQEMRRIETMKPISLSCGVRWRERARAKAVRRCPLTFTARPYATSTPSSTFINVYQRSSTLSTFINAHQRSSTFINAHQRSSTLINAHQRSSTFINVHQRSSTLINAHQRSSTHPRCTQTLKSLFALRSDGRCSLLLRMD